ncbi:MAG TPA: hypothetical protein VK837_10515 [Longimicrobiales bacterium]|nr:hypothetical protein [Longimicrobiales bacterium]
MHLASVGLATVTAVIISLLVSPVDAQEAPSSLVGLPLVLLPLLLALLLKAGADRLRRS